MKKNMYARGNGAKVLKKRFQAFDKIFILGLAALIVGLYLSMQSQIKSVVKTTGDLMIEKKLLSEELGRLRSDYEKTVSYNDLKNFAGSRLSMVETCTKIKSFTVVDREGSFRTVQESQMPVLFDTKVNLALLRQNALSPEN